MGFSLGGILKNVVSTVAPKFVDAIKSVSSEAVGALKDVVSSGFDSLVKSAGDSIGKLATGFPEIAGLASKLLGQGSEAVKGLIEQGAGGLQKWLNDKIGQLSPKTLENGESVTTPTFANRDFGAELGNIKDIISKFFPQAPNQESYDAQFKSAVETLSKNFSALDTAAGIGGKDGVIGKADLKAALNNPSFPKELKDAIRFLTQNPAAMNQLDVAAGKGNVDGFISKADMDAAVKSLAPADTTAPASTLTPEQKAMLDKIQDPAIKSALSAVFEQMNKATATSTATGNTGVTGAGTGTTAATPAASNDVLTKILEALKQLVPGASTSSTGTASNDLMAQLTNLLKQAGLVPNTTTGTAATTATTGTSTGAATGTTGGTSTTSTPATTTTTPAATTAAGGSMVDILNRGLAGANGQLTQQENDMLSKIQDPNQKAMMKAQMEMQHAQEMLSFISNIMKKMNEMAMAVIGNMR